MIGRRKTPRVWDVCVKVEFKIKDNDELRTETARFGSLFKTYIKRKGQPSDQHDSITYNTWPNTNVG